ncbi:acyl carrier protein [Lachnospiraceae bacterium 50-23]
MNIKEKLQEVFREVFEDEEIVLREEMTAEDIEDWDSLTHIQLIEAIEEEFDIRFILQEITGLSNVGEFLAMVERKLGGK